MTDTNEHAEATDGSERKMRLFVNSNANMSRGKYAAAAVHAALTAVGAHPGTPVVVLGAPRAEVEQMGVVIRDAGRTEVDPGTVTAGTDWPTPDLGDMESAGAWRVLADFVVGTRSGEPIELANFMRERIAAALRQGASLRDGLPVDADGIEGVIRLADLAEVDGATQTTREVEHPVHLVEKIDSGWQLIVTRTDDGPTALAAVRAYVAAHRTGAEDWGVYDSTSGADVWALDRALSNIETCKATARASRVAHRPSTTAEEDAFGVSHLITERNGRGSTPAVIWESVL